MAESKNQHLVRLFDPTLELPAASRAAFLERECAGDQSGTPAVFAARRVAPRSELGVRASPGACFGMTRRTRFIRSLVAFLANPCLMSGLRRTFICRIPSSRADLFGYSPSNGQTASRRLSTSLDGLPAWSQESRSANSSQRATTSGTRRLLRSCCGGRLRPQAFHSARVRAKRS